MSDALNLVVRFSALDSLSGSLKNLIGLGKTGSQAMRDLNRDAGRLKGELRGVRTELAGSSGNVTHLIDRERALEAQLERTNRALERQKRINVIDGRTARIKARGEELKSSGQQNVIAGAGLITPFVLAGKAAMDFSSGMVDIQQKAELTNAETAAMARNIIAAARATHMMPEDMRKGVDTLAGLGMDPRQAARLMDPIGRATTAFKAEMADVAAATFSNLNTLKVAATDTGRALDIMAAGGNRGAFELKDMARWFPTLTAQAQALGQKGLPAVADLTAALQIARRGTGTADEAGNNIQNLLAKINAKPTITAFSKNFGVDLPAALRKAYAEGKTPLEAIAEITKKATGGDLSRLSFAFEDMQAQNALRSLIQNMEDFRSIRAQVAASSGTIDKAFDQRRLQDASVAWASFKGTVSSLAITLGTTLLPVATRFFGYLDTGIGAINRWAQANPRLAQGLLTLVAGLAAARVGLGVLQYAFGSILGPIATVWGAFDKIKTAGSFAAAFPRIAKSFGVLRTAALFLGRGLMRAGMMMLANPMILAIVAIGAVIAVAAYLVYRNWDKIAGAFTGGVARVRNVWGALAGAFTRNWTTIRNVALGLIVIFAPMVALMMLAASKIYHNWDRIKGATTSAVSAVGGAVNRLAQPFLTVGRFMVGLVARFMSFGAAVVRALLQPFATVAGFMAGLAGRFFAFGANIVRGLINGILSMAGGVTRAIISLAAGVGAKFAAQLGIKSPSRVFMMMGGYVTQGLALGIDRGGRHPMRSIGRLAAGVAGAGALGLAAPTFAAPAPLERGPALSARAGRPGADHGRSLGPITIQIFQQPGEDADALADRVMRKLEERQRRGRLSSYQDDF